MRFFLEQVLLDLAWLLRWVGPRALKALPFLTGLAAGVAAALVVGGWV